MPILPCIHYLLVSEFSSIILEVANCTLSRKVWKEGKKYIKKPLENELGKHYHTLLQGKKSFVAAKRLLYRNRENRDRRQEMIIARRQYKKIKYTVFKYNKRDKLEKIAHLENKDPKAFWTGIKKIISPTNDSSNNITPNRWIEHFSNLLNIKQNDSSFLDYINSSLPTIEKEMLGRGPLDDDFSIQEVQGCLKSAKNGKASGPDRIRNEMLKAGDSTFQEALRYVFNKILAAGIYPDVWKMSYLSPIFKAGDTEDPNNYRGGGSR